MQRILPVKMYILQLDAVILTWKKIWVNFNYYNKRAGYKTSEAGRSLKVSNIVSYYN